MNKRTTQIIFILIIVSILIMWIYILEDDREEQNKVVYTVKEGDTLYSIAKEFKPKEMDVREYVHKIRELNDINPIISVGEDIIILKYDK